MLLHKPNDAVQQATGISVGGFQQQGNGTILHEMPFDRTEFFLITMEITVKNLKSFARFLMASEFPERHYLRNSLTNVADLGETTSEGLILRATSFSAFMFSLATDTSCD